MNDFLKTANSVSSPIGFKLGSSWETYVKELHKFPWTNLDLTSLELEKSGERTQTKQLEDCILYSIIFQMVSTPTILVTWKFMKIPTRGVQCPDSVVRKD